MSKVSERYFSIIKDYFSDLLDWASRKGYYGPESLQATAELYSPRLMKTVMESLYHELVSLDWIAQENTIATLGGLRTAYLGHAYMYKRSSTETFDFLKKTSLYSDTTIINDPILSELLTWRKRGTGEVISFHLVAQWAIHLLSIEDLFSSELSPPICILAPCSVLSLEARNLLDVAERFIHENVVPSYASDLFGKDLASSKKLRRFLSKIKNFNEFTALMQKPEMLTTPDGELVGERDFLSVKKYYDDKYNTNISLPTSLWLLLRGRYTMAIYDLILNGKFASNFITDFKGVWDGLLWLIENNNELVFEHLERKPISKDMLIMNALQQEELKWIGNVPLNRIKELRERGELQEIRNIIGQNIKDIANASDEEFVEVGRQVKHNLEETFKRHASEVKDLDEKYRRKYKIDVASVVVSGSLGIVSALFPPFALATGVVSSIVGGESVIQTAKDYLTKREHLQALRKKPVAMLFDAHKPVTRSRL